MKKLLIAVCFLAVSQAFADGESSLGKNSQDSWYVQNFLDQADIPYDKIIDSIGNPISRYVVKKLQCWPITMSTGEFQRCVFKLPKKREIVKIYKQFAEAEAVMGILQKIPSDPNAVVEFNTYYNLICDVWLSDPISVECRLGKQK